MRNNDEELKMISDCKCLEVKRQMVINYIGTIFATKLRKNKLCLEVRQMNSVSRLDFFIYNLYLVGDGNKVIKAA